MTLFTLRIIV